MTLILYCSDKFGIISGFAVNGYINGLTSVDETCFNLQVQYMLGFLNEGAIIDAVFVQDQDEDAFWSACKQIKEGEKYQ